MTIRDGSISLHRGDDYDETLTFTNDSGAALDLTGFKFWFTMKTKDQGVADLDATLQLSSPSSGITFKSGDPTLGVIYLSITSVQSAAFVPSTYKFDVQIKNASNKISTLILGDVLVKPDITITTT